MNGRSPLGSGSRMPRIGLPMGISIPRLAAIRDDPAAAIATAAPLAAGLVGIAFAADLKVGIALTLALLYLPLALISLELAITLWLPLAFLEALPTFNLAVKVGGLVLVGLWVVLIGKRRETISAAIGRNPIFWGAVGGLLIWVTLSLLWATDRGEVYADLWHWYADALLALIIATTFVTERTIRWLVVAFVVGAVISVAQGIVSGGLTTSSDAVFSESEGRLSGGLGDPNFLAAAIVPAMVLSISLIPGTRSLWFRWALVSVLPLLALGLAASESRGGIVAAVTALVAAIVVFKRQRGAVVAFAVAAVTVVVAWFMISPTAWDRITESESGGSGRSDLWAIAWRVVEDRPVLGAGLNNFIVVSKDYLQEPGTIDRADLILDDREVVHNAYLQMFAEAGVIGLALLLTVMFGSIGAAWNAMRRFEADGRSQMDILTRGYIVAMTGMLAASFFISSGVDKRLWTLLAIGPALAAIARSPSPARQRAPSAADEAAKRSYPRGHLELEPR
jgi:O-antigen ligase